MRPKQRVAIVGMLAAAIAVSACAAHGARNKTRVTALTASRAAIGVSQTESDLYAAGAYDKAMHDGMDKPILALLYAARAFERTAAAWQDGQATPLALKDSRDAVLKALADIEQVLPAGKAREGLTTALAAVKGALDALPVPAGAELPPNVVALFALMQVVAGLIQSGRSTVASILAALRKEGATDEELASVDAGLTDEILRREREAGNG